MNDHKFCFIICTNNELLLGEAVLYIHSLIVPDGYSVELLTVKDAASMTSGYNEAMEASDAKYKIYMHQDVFILNKNFLRDILSIFHSDPQIGMIGMVGYETVSDAGLMWHSKRCGSPYQIKPDIPYPSLSEYNYSLCGDGYTLVAQTDGFMMITAHDYPWNTEILKDWDFYDVYQSLTFLAHGYKIAVPTQRHPWCMHDDGIVVNLTNYNYYRQIFMRTHKNILGKHYSEIIKKT